MKYVWWNEVDTDVQPTFEVPGFTVDERENLTPALERAGFTFVGRWFTGDGDSFGPLTRCVEAVNPAGETVVVVYG